MYTGDDRAFLSTNNSPNDTWFDVSNLSYAIMIPFTVIIEFSKLTFDNSEFIGDGLSLFWMYKLSSRVELDQFTSPITYSAVCPSTFQNVCGTRHLHSCKMNWMSTGWTRGENSEMESKIVHPTLLNRSFVKDARWESLNFSVLKKYFANFLLNLDPKTYPC